MENATAENADHLATATGDISEVLDVYLLDENRRPTSGDTPIGTLKDFMGGKVLQTGHLLANETSETIYVVIKMQESADNAYQNASANFDILLRARQYTYESDSFDNQYDANATWSGEIEKINITYMTNADVEMGTVTYSVGAENAFPQSSELGKIFPEFFSRLANVTNVWLSGYYTDKDFTNPATMPEEHGDYTVYVKLNNNAYFDSIQYTDTSGGATYLYERTGSNGGPTTMEPECSIEIGNSFGLRYISLGFQCAGRDNDPTIVVEKKNGETWEPIDESRFLMDIMITFTPYVGDEGDYRISALYYTAEDQDGNPLYYDYAEIPENLIHVTYVY